jgi:hypothetical protein
MKKITVTLFSSLALILFPAASLMADLAGAMSCYKHHLSTEKDCQLLLIGTIDSVYGLKDACADGKTSYKFLIEAWVRLLDRNPELRDLPTILTMKRTMLEQGMSCK